MKLAFKGYYKYVFTFDVLDEKGRVIGVFRYGGDADDIYRLEIKPTMELEDFLLEDDIEAFKNGKEFDLWADGFELKYT